MNMAAVTDSNLRPEQNSGRNPNSGHGHVYKRPDGVKARCGGPSICAECARDMAQLTAAQKPQAVLPSNQRVLHVCHTPCMICENERLHVVLKNQQEATHANFLQIERLRAALKVVYTLSGGHSTECQCRQCEIFEFLEPIVGNGSAALSADSLAQEAQKPVAWRYKDTRGNWRYTGSEPKPEHAILKAEPLYGARALREPTEGES